MENSETRVWLDFAEACKYLDSETKNRMDEQCVEIGKLLNHMIEFPEKYTRKQTSSS
jgi:four helix bundle protein